MPVGTKNFPTSLDTVLELVEVTNDASTALNGALTIGATTVTVDSTSLFPSSGIITIDSENISYTGKSGTTFTGCTRGAESTTAATHDDNATVELLITAALPNVHAQAIIAIETKLGIDSSTPTANKVLRATGTGTSAWGAVVNADIDASAAIAVSKLAALTASRLPVLDASGFLSASSVTATEAGYLSGVTSAIQTQLDAKQTAFGSQTANYVYAGPTTGGAASPSFRALVAADIPSHNQAWSTITSTPTTLSGYGITDAQGLDSDLTAIAALSPSNDDIIQRKTGAWTNRTMTQLTADLIAMVGDSGSGGTKGLVPAPSAGDAAAGKFLKADGTWTAAGGGITIGSTTITSGTNTRILYNNSGVVGEYTLTGTGTTVAMSAGPTFTGTATLATLSLSSLISTAVSPSQITTSQNDYAGATGFINRLDSDAHDNIVSGMVAGTAGQLAYDINVGSFDLVYTHQSGNSSAANRFDNPGDMAFTLHPGDTVARIYDGTTQRWRLLSNPYVFAPNVTSGAGTTGSSHDSAGVIFKANSLTSGDGVAMSSSSITAGNVLKIEATGTAAASNTKTALNVATSGANGTSTQTTYGGRFSNTSTGTSSTNIGADFSASGGTNNYAINVSAGQSVFPDGSVGTPSIVGNNTKTSGFYFSAAAIAASISGSLKWYSDANNFYIYAAGYQLNFSRSGNDDVILRGNAAANLALGTTDAASPVAQTLSVQGGTGTNTAGATFSLRGSLGTSQGAPGRVHIKGGALIAASGTTTHTAVDRHISGATKVLTNNSAIAIVNATAATETNAAGVIDYAVEVLDGTDVQYEVGSVAYGVSNKGGVFSGNTATKFGNHQNVTSGSLTVTFAITGANPAVLSVNANSSLSPSTGYPRITYTLRNLTQQAVAIQ